MTAFNQHRKAIDAIGRKVPMEEIQRLAKDEFPYDKANPGQMECIVEAIDALINKKVKHVIIEAPTGVGKSLIGTTIHKVIRHLVLQADPYGQFRTSISTPTKGLQDQYAAEKAVSIDILKGKKNYRCHVHPDVYYNAVQCRIACRDGHCSKRRCPYVQARNLWTDISSLRCTNAAMMIEMCTTICMKPENRSDMLILDECHKMPSTLLEHTIMEYNTKAVEGLRSIPEGKEIVSTIGDIVERTKDYVLGKLYSLSGELHSMFEDLHLKVENLLEVLEELVEDDRLSESQVMKLADIIDVLHNLSDYCGIMSQTQASTFIVQEKGEGFIRFKPVMPSDVSEFGLFRKADYHVHMSATICGIDSYARSLGIRQGDYHSIQIGNPIPIENRKVNYMPIVKMTNNMGDYEMKRLTEYIDEIIAFHPGQSGIIHTVSYDRALAIQKFSKYQNFIHVPRTRKALMDIMENAFRTKSPCVIASPAMEEGYDFKGDYSRFQILIKVPYDYLGDPLIAHINSVDPSAYFRNAVLRIVQMCGRSVRGVDDWAATYIIDSSFESLMMRNPEFFPTWFTDAVFEV
ncbi:DNA helicase [Salmonella phage SenASZ3]|uniref:DNA helicase n=1 Tax=Salmonella phage SenASZ3 TaxID=2301648 RepID=A0A385ITA3_9CAUD|nr:DNA helicase [Salmonella phage SenASZ3]AXY86582.1 DNA helicase [Salmonella phage SenASZ3]